jgi:hypothetical protein
MLLLKELSSFKWLKKEKVPCSFITEGIPKSGKLIKAGPEYRNASLKSGISIISILFLFMNSFRNIVYALNLLSIFTNLPRNLFRENLRRRLFP